MRRHDFGFIRPLAAAATLAAAGLLSLGPAASPASACGGFFCNNSQPVNQQAERIVFTQNEDGSVTAVIQIMYQGPSEEFAWLLPVQGSPEVAVSSNAAFQRLQQLTNPQYRMNVTVEGTCRDDFGTRRSGPSAGGFADAGTASPDDGGESGVDVVDEGSVGPYDYVVISVDPSLPDAADVAVNWLTEEGYDVTDFGANRLQPYLEGGNNLLAFRLTKGNDAGSIRPVQLTFGNGLPSIPIRPTAVAATEDMGVMVWVVGQERAVPVNYKSLELNQALINWFNPNSGYNDVVIEAANEAGGQGFVTEMAGSTEGAANAIFSDFERSEWESIQSMDWTGREGQLLQRGLGQFARLDGARDVIRETVPVPDGVTIDELLGCVFCYYDGSETDIAGFDPEAFISSMQVNVIEPMQQTADLFADLPYMTRLYTTMSPDEMTKDPVFDFNADLPDHDNVHVAERIIECSPSVTRSEAPWRVVLPQGGVVRGEGTTWPFDTEDDGGMPANYQVRAVGSEGEGEVVEDNVGAIQSALDSHNDTVPGPPSAGRCAVHESAGAVGGGLAMAALVGLALAARRRRRR